MKRTKAKTQCEAEVRLGNKIGYLFVAGIHDSDAAIGCGTTLRSYLREERKSVFGYVIPTKEERAAIDKWMDKSEVGDTLFAADRSWLITVVSMERAALQRLQAVTPSTVYETVPMRGPKNKKGKL